MKDMMSNEGFWYSIGRGFWSFFKGLDWCYDHLSPNLIFIAIGFLAFFAWLKVQGDYNKKAAKEGTLK